MSEATDQTAAPDSGISIVRIFDAPPERVWRAWTEPDQFRHWFGTAAATIPLETVSMDVRQSGAWNATMFWGPDHTEIPWRGVYQEVVPFERLAFTLADRPGDDYELVTVVLRDLDGKTEMDFSQVGGHLSDEEYDGAKVGWLGFFDDLADLVQQI